MRMDIMDIEHALQSLENPKLPQCELIEVIGAGTFGITFKAIWRTNDKVCAIKVLKDDFFSQEEAKRLKDVDHRNIVNVFDAGDRFLAMDFVDGYTLAATLNHMREIHGRPFLAEGWLRYLRSILIAIDHLHSKQLVHRDIKPDNIIIRREDDEPVLVDFGSVRRVGDRTVYYGTPTYSPREAFFPSVVPQYSWDIFSMAVVSFEMLFGDLPKANGGSLDYAQMISKLQQHKAAYVKAIADGLRAQTERPKSVLEWVLRMVTESATGSESGGGTTCEQTTGMPTSTVYDSEIYSPPTNATKTGCNAGHTAYDVKLVEMYKDAILEDSDWTRNVIVEGILVKGLQLFDIGDEEYYEMTRPFKQRRAIMNWLVDEYPNNFLDWYEKNLNVDLLTIRSEMATSFDIPESSVVFFWTNGECAIGEVKFGEFVHHWTELGPVNVKPSDELLEKFSRNIAAIEDKTVSWLIQTLYRVFGIPSPAIKIVKPPAGSEAYAGRTMVRTVRANWNNFT